MSSLYEVFFQNATPRCKMQQKGLGFNGGMDLSKAIQPGSFVILREIAWLQYPIECFVKFFCSVFSQCAYMKIMSINIKYSAE